MNSRTQNGLNKKSELPEWNLTNIYPSLDSKEYDNDLRRFTEQLSKLEETLKNSPKNGKSVVNWLKNYIHIANTVFDLLENLEAYTYTIYSANSYNKRALERINELESISLPLAGIRVNFRNKLAQFKRLLSTDLLTSNALDDYSFYIHEQLLLSEKQMTEKEEDLANDLNRAGADAWSRLHEVVSSQLKITWDPETGEKKTVTELRALAHNPDRTIREKAYKLELSAWESMKVPLSFALNGVKGFSVILNKRRHYSDTLERSIIQSRISRATLDSLLEAMKGSLPDFRRYLRGKAQLLGLKKLSFYDIFAPVAESAKKWSFKEARKFILDQFSRFSPDLGSFAENAFLENWIDAEPKDGKIGGAYCITIPLQRESRILCNFDGSFSSVSTVAHELGHAYHHDILKDTPHILRTYPMTLAETASIFCENLVLNGAAEQFAGREKLNAMEIFLADSTQVIVDILSRFIFESEVFKIREKKELSADELNGIMINAQKTTYGDALNEKELHPYMWAAKGHYYRSELAFYNFPYAFGLLFGIGLYSQFKKNSIGFVDKYRSILKETGKKSAVDITRDVGFDIEKPDFWMSGLDIIRDRIDQFLKMKQEVQED